MTASIPNASITARQMKKSRLKKLQMRRGQSFQGGDEEPVVDGELHDGVGVDAGPEDPPLLLLNLLLYLLCG